MSIYLNKSRGNVRCAEMIVETNNYIVSAHLVYYAVFLLVKYILATFLKCSYVEQEKIVKEKGSHNNIRTTFFRKAIEGNFITKRDKSDYDSCFKEIQILRVMSDYQDSIIPKEEINNNLNNANGLIKNLSTKFNISQI